MSLDFESLVTTLEGGGHPFVLYRYPAESHLHVIIDSSKQLRVLSGDGTESGFVFAAFDSSLPAVILHPDVHTTFPVSQLPDTSLADEDNVSLSHKTDELVAKDSYVSLVSAAIREIEDSDIKKIVTSRTMRVDYDSIDMAAVYASMCSTYPDAFVYYFSHPSIGRWAGASPELLLLRRGEDIHTMSLAGTQPYEGEKMYRWKEKEVEEQDIVTRYIRDVLSSCGVKDIKIKGPDNHRAAGVVHLCSHISGTMKEGVDMRDMIKKLSPTPALCGYPKDLSMMFIKKNESHDRMFYGGYLGELNMAGNATAELYVNIRCMQLSDNHLTMYAGGGITAQSSPSDEWEETCHKMKTISRVVAPYIYKG